MKKSSVIILIASALSLILIVGAATVIYPYLSSFVSPSLGATEETEKGNTEWAKGVTVYDKDGNAVSLEDFTGKPIIVNFWASWCIYCLEELPDFDNAFKEYGDEIQFVIVNSSDTIKKGEEIITKNGYSFPTYYDLEDEAYFAYYLSSLPRTLAIDKDGNVVYNRSGMLTEESLQAVIDLVK